MAEAALWWVGMLGKVDVLQAALVASVRRAPPRFMRNIARWRETCEEMAENSGVFIKRHQINGNLA